MRAGTACVGHTAARVRQVNADRWTIIEDNAEIDGGTGCIRGRNNEDHGAVTVTFDYEIACLMGSDGQKEHEELEAVMRHDDTDTDPF